MRTIALALAYDGTRYVGWQRQPDGQSIQALVESALSAIEQRPVAVTGAGRTDAGVHATGQVASCVLAHPIDCRRLVRAVNARLPGDVRVLRADERPEGFNARYAATAKRYRYVVGALNIADPFDLRYAWHVPVALDVEKMAEAIACLAGRHDFASFCGAGSHATTTERTLYEVSCHLVPGGAQGGWRPVAATAPRIAIEMRGDGFLRHMVRNVVGTLVEVGKRRWPASAVADILAARDRRRAGPTAPPQGLCLVHVDYEPVQVPSLQAASSDVAS